MQRQLQNRIPFGDDKQECKCKSECKSRTNTKRFFHFDYLRVRMTTRKRGGLLGADEGYCSEVVGGVGFGEGEILQAVPGKFAEVVGLIEDGLGEFGC